MWFKDVFIKPKDIKEPTTIFANGVEGDAKVSNFPLFVVGIDSYIYYGVIQTEIFQKPQLCHNMQIGNYCSFGDHPNFMIDRNHDYGSVTTAAASFLDAEQMQNNWKIKRKGQILVENDVWVGNNATIMSGVTIHNGAVVAAEAVVSKDVPPYAIVGGNPAKVIKYRFAQDQIEKLQTIRWWEWDNEKLEKNKLWFTKEISEFTGHFYDEAVRAKEKVPDLDFEKKKNTYLLIPDFEDGYPVYPRVISEYCETYHDRPDGRLLIYIPESEHTELYISQLKEIVSKYPEDIDIYTYIDALADERSVFKKADTFITTRNTKTVYWVGCAEQYGLKVLSGVDVPIFL